jgi:CRP-like cAMP-binding protein
MSAVGPSYPEGVDTETRRRWANALAQMNVLGVANDDSTAAVFEAATFAQHAAGEVVLKAGETRAAVFFLLEGVVRVFQEHEGTQYTPKLLRAPLAFGEVGYLAGRGQQTSNIAASTDIVVAEVPFVVIEARLAVDNAMCLCWLRSIAGQLASTIDVLRQNMFGDVRSRIAHVLLGYADALGEGADARPQVPRLSYRVMAEQVAATRRRVITAVQELVDGGYLTATDDGWILDRRRIETELLRHASGNPAFALTDTGA